MCVCVRDDGLEYARFNASPTMNDVPTNKFECRTHIYFGKRQQHRIIGLYIVYYKNATPVRCVHTHYEGDS